jgi:hypothetical protein
MRTHAIVRPLTPLLVAGLTLCAGACRESADRGIAGIWVMELDERPFMVLTLDATGEGVEGTLVRPETMTTDGLSVSGVEGGIVSERVTGAAQDATAWRIVAEDSADPADTTEFELRMLSADEAGIRPAGAPFEPLPFRRHRGSDTPQVSTEWDSRRSYAIRDAYVPPNADMEAIYRDDQAVRQSLEAFEAEAAGIDREDALRRERTRALLEAGELRAAEDFRLAALVFQHGGEPADYLFAHTLALVALAKGDRSAAWIAAASLDRYLRAIDKPQIYGTNFDTGTLNQEPFDASLVSDALRRELGVPALADQRELMKTILQNTTENAPGR